MRTLTTSVLACLLSFSVAASMEDIYAVQNGTCTKETCIKGDAVKVFASSGDSTLVQREDGESIDATKLTGLKFTVDGIDDKCAECAIVTSPSGTKFLIPRIFLKKLS